MEKIECIIIEDELPAIDELKFILSQYDFIKIMGTAYDGESGFELATRFNPDVVFLDINIPLINGMDLAKKIKDFDEGIEIVFVTAYEQHAVKAFEIDAADYILKPYDEKRIDETVKRLLEDFKGNNNSKDAITDKIEAIIKKLEKDDKILKKIPCDFHGKTILIDMKDVYFCFIEEEKTFLKTKDKKFLTTFALHEVENKTPLFRVHRSYLVNLDNIKELFPWFHGTYKLIMNDIEKSEIPVSRSNVKKLKEILGL